jgi:hypothetical protein
MPIAPTLHHEIFEKAVALDIRNSWEHGFSAPMTRYRDEMSPTVGSEPRGARPGDGTAWFRFDGMLQAAMATVLRRVTRERMARNRMAIPPLVRNMVPGSGTGVSRNACICESMIP